MSHSKAYLRIARDLERIIPPHPLEPWQGQRNRVRSLLKGSKNLINRVSGIYHRRIRTNISDVSERYRTKSLQKITKILAKR